jgi:hypothetical protein
MWTIQFGAISDTSRKHLHRIGRQTFSMEFEEGELSEHSPPRMIPGQSPYDYEPSLEWPGDTDPMAEELPTQSIRLPSRNQPLCRCVVSRTSVLSSKHRIVSIDQFPAVQFGRDPSVGALSPRVRLREMEVSKHHATVYWDSTRNEWSVVDMGSKHGTFVRSLAALEPPDKDTVGVRLSSPRTASMPRALRHMDRLTIGSTTFIFHIHGDNTPCSECTTSGADIEVPLFPTKKLVPSVSDSVSGTKAAYAPPSHKDPRSALTSLKRSLLAQHNDKASIGPSSGDYFDRSARRRALYPASGPDAPGVMTIPSQPAAKLTYQSAPEPLKVDLPPPDQLPLSTTNIGHRLLMKQGWQPGSALGATVEEGGRVALLEPVEVVVNTNRAGLGSSRPEEPPSASSAGLNWKETARQRRWESVG